MAPVSDYDSLEPRRRVFVWNMVTNTAFGSTIHVYILCACGVTLAMTVWMCCAMVLGVGGVRSYVVHIGY